MKYVIFDQQLNNRLIFYLNLQACKQGLLQHLEHLLFYGVDMDVQNANGNTAIHVCALHNQVRLWIKSIENKTYNQPQWYYPPCCLVWRHGNNKFWAMFCHFNTKPNRHKYLFALSYNDLRDHHGHDRMVVGFTTTNTISVYHHLSCEFESHPWWGILNTTLCRKVCQWLAANRCFLWVLGFPPPIKPTVKI